MMKYTKEDVMEYVGEEDVKFIRLAFNDPFGKQKNISIMAGELPKAFAEGIEIEGWAVDGFGPNTVVKLHPDPNTLSVLPWRPEHGKVVRMFCTMTNKDGTPFKMDTRRILVDAVEDAQKAGIQFDIGSAMEFYLLKADDNGESTGVPYDNAGFMDIAPEDKGENIRREICLMLEQMDIIPEKSHHEAGPGQNEIVFKYSDALKAADDTLAFFTVVRIVAQRNGVCADFSPKPIIDKPGSCFKIRLYVNGSDKKKLLEGVTAGIEKHLSEITVFLNTTKNSYKRIAGRTLISHKGEALDFTNGVVKLVDGDKPYVELSSPDPLLNPYLAFAALIRAGLAGVENGYSMYTEETILKSEDRLPSDIDEAKALAKSSDFVKSILPEELIDIYCE